MRATVVFIALCLSAVGLAASPSVDASTRKSTNIPAQELGSALRAFEKDRNLQVIFVSEDVRDVRTQGAVGEFTPDEALKVLLTGTGLTFRYLDEKTVTLVPVRNSASSDTSVAPPFDANAQLPPVPEGSKVPSDRFRVAQVDQGVVGPSAVVGDQNSQEKKKDEGLSEIVVTGTYIRGVAPTGSNLIVYTRDDIDQSGAATIDEFARQMPENFSGADLVANRFSNANLALFNTSASSNLFGGAGFDLFGVGPSATLTLLNGNRLAPAGYDGSFTDISIIPLSAIEHIEVLSDGASAIYGADAVAGVVNIITRKDFDGEETSLRYGEGTGGGAIERTASQLLGRSWTTGNVLLNYEFDDQSGLDASQRSYIPTQGGPTSLVPQSRRNSVFLAAKQDIGPSTAIFGNAIYSNHSSFIANTLDSSILFQSTSQPSRTTLSGATLTVEQAFAGDWNGRMAGNYSKVQQTGNQGSTLAQGPTSTPYLNVLSTDSDIAELNLIATGPLISLPGGQVKAAFGTSFRQEKFDSSDEDSSAGALLFSLVVPAAQRNVTSVFGEFVVPIIGQSNAMSLAQRIEISAAGRYDHYTDFGSTTNPKIGVLWEPVRGLAVRATYGTSFRAPLLSQLLSPVQSYTQPLPNPAAATGVTDTLLLQGGNPNLGPEKSRSFAAGFDVKPDSLPNFKLAGTYFHIAFDDRISTPPLVGSNYFGDPALEPFITPNPSLAAVQSYFNVPGFEGDFAGDGPAGVQAIFDSRNANIAATTESGVNITTYYRLATDFGLYVFSFAVDRLLKNNYETASGVPNIALLNTFGEPPRLKGRGGIAWTQGRLAAAVNVNYVNSYQNSLTVPPQGIDPWTTVDLNIRYKTDGSASYYLLRNLTIALNIQNLIDKKPPYVQIPAVDLLPGENPIPFDPTNASPFGRFVSLQFTKGWGHY